MSDFIGRSVAEVTFVICFVMLLVLNCDLIFRKRVDLDEALWQRPWFVRLGHYLDEDWTR